VESLPSTHRGEENLASVQEFRSFVRLIHDTHRRHSRRQKVAACDCSPSPPYNTLTLGPEPLSTLTRRGNNGTPKILPLLAIDTDARAGAPPEVLSSVPRCSVDQDGHEKMALNSMGGAGQSHSQSSLPALPAHLQSDTHLTAHLASRSVVEFRRSGTADANRSQDFMFPSRCRDFPPKR
jgi:hypothetical protein